mmetsp:Transcript_56807/g.133130  ORF Transcript_56807/g.133130 Transcript_56807/m.133130 type:complete len:217 (+) Transcript_56807:429-1079(+)
MAAEARGASERGRDGRRGGCGGRRRESGREAPAGAEAVAGRDAGCAALGRVSAERRVRGVPGDGGAVRVRDAVCRGLPAHLCARAHEQHHRDPHRRLQAPCAAAAAAVQVRGGHRDVAGHSRHPHHLLRPHQLRPRRLHQPRAVLLLPADAAGAARVDHPHLRAPPPPPQAPRRHIHQRRAQGDGGQVQETRRRPGCCDADRQVQGARRGRASVLH